MLQSLFQKLCRLLLSALLLTFVGSFFLFQSASAASMVTPPTASPTTPLIPNVTCTTSDNPSIYAWYNSIKGSIPLRIGYQNTPRNMGYGYCHIQAKHPTALPPVVGYILEYGQVVAVTSASFTVRGYYADGHQYQVYVSTIVQGDGATKGVVSAYPYPGGD